MYTITNNCQGFITSIVYKDRHPVEEFEALTKELNGFVKDKCLFVLSDLRTAKLCLNSEELHKMEKIDRENRKPDVVVYEALLCKGPLETTVSKLFSTTKVSANHNIKVFSSENDAIHWLESYHNYSFT